MKVGRGYRGVNEGFTDICAGIFIYRNVYKTTTYISHMDIYIDIQNKCVYDKYKYNTRV